MGAQRWQEQVWTDARGALPDHVWRYFTAGSRDAVSLGEAVAAWSDVRLWPRVLTDVRNPSTATTLLGTPTSSPVGIAPTSLQRLAHPEGEVAMARAAAATDTLLVVSSNAGSPFADIGATGVSWWLQAYVTADRGLIAPAFQAAAAAGARAIVLTVDTPVPGAKYDIDEAAFGDLSSAYGTNHPDAVRGETEGAEHAQDLAPRDITWLRELTGLPVVVKGVLRADDARRCVDAGAAAVWVSNHGGRQLDRAVSTRAALSHVVAGLADSVEVYVDGGIRSGLDVVSAVALGARAAFCGRLPLLALAAGGSGRVIESLEALHLEVLDGLRLAGCSDVLDAAWLTDP
ncbi:MAG: alpha-hydroxy acid oxidase [Nocardioides sp.]